MTTRMGQGDFIEGASCWVQVTERYYWPDVSRGFVAGSVNQACATLEVSGCRSTGLISVCGSTNRRGAVDIFKAHGG